MMLVCAYVTIETRNTPEGEKDVVLILVDVRNPFSMPSLKFSLMTVNIINPTHSTFDPSKGLSV